MKSLLEEQVQPAKPDETALITEAIQPLLEELDHDWQCVEDHHLTKEFSFDDFLSALDFVNSVGQYAEKVNHHPEITFTWGKASIVIYTHDVEGLRRADFVWAAHVQQLYQSNS